MDRPDILLLLGIIPYYCPHMASPKREYYEYLLQTAAFWEDYLVFENGEYSDYNDSLHEVGWYMGPDYMPDAQDDKNPLLSACLIRMLMKLLIELSRELGKNLDKIAKWQEILDHAPAIETFSLDGVDYLRCKAGSEMINELTMECVYPMGMFGRYLTPELFEAVKNTHQKLSIWDSNNRFCSYYPAAARIGIPAEEIIGHIHEAIERHGLPNGMFRYDGGGIENSSAIPSTVNEMLLQSYEGVLRLFPVWDRNRYASFRGLRANGAFIVDASLNNGVITATVTSECDQLLRLEYPGDGYVCISQTQKIPLIEPITDITTTPGEIFHICQETT